MKLNPLVMAGICAIALAMPASAQTLSRVNVTVPFGEGGGTDTLIRAMAPHLQQALPGRPNILIRNEPGGGGIPATNRFVRSAAADGTDLITLSSSIFVTYALGSPQINFRMTDFIPVFVSSQGPVIYVSPSTGATGPGDLAGIGDTELVFGASAPNSAHVLTLFQLEQLGLNVRAIWGMERGPARIAYERGELNLDYQTGLAFAANAQPLVDAGLAVPLMTTGLFTPQGEGVRDPMYPELPTFLELYEQVHGEPATGPVLESYMVLSSAANMIARVVALPAGTPPEMVAAYDQAFAGMMENASFMEQSGASIGNYPVFLGDDARAVYAIGADLSDETYAWLQDWFRRVVNFEISR